jgi:hypothetical protein
LLPLTAGSGIHAEARALQALADGVDPDLAGNAGRGLDPGLAVQDQRTADQGRGQRRTERQLGPARLRPAARLLLPSLPPRRGAADRLLLRLVKSRKINRLRHRLLCHAQPPHHLARSLEPVLTALADDVHGRVIARQFSTCN